MLNFIITDWFTLMFAAIGGFGITHFLARSNVPKQPLKRLGLALLLAAYASGLYFSATQNLQMALTVAGFAFAGVGSRSFMELCLRHWEISQAIEAINALPTLEERLTYLGTLPVGIQHSVLRRTLGPQLMPMYRW